MDRTRFEIAEPTAETRHLWTAIGALRDRVTALETHRHWPNQPEEPPILRPSSAAPPTTASPIEAGHSAVGTDLMTLTIPTSLPLLGDRMEAVLTHVERCSLCAPLWNAFWSGYLTPAQGARGISLTYQRPESESSAAMTAAVSTSPSAGSSEASAEAQKQEARE